MKITKKELSEMIQEAIKQSLNESEKLNESGDFMSRRELLHKARDASFKFEQEIIKTLDLEDPNKMAPEDRTTFLHIVRAMGKGITNSVAKAIISMKRSNLPQKANEKEILATPETSNPGPGSKTAATPPGTAVTPHNRVDATKKV